MKKALLTLIFMASATFAFSQTVPLLIQNNTASPIMVDIWAVTEPGCDPACLIATGVVIPAFSLHNEPAPGGPCTTWGRVYVTDGGAGPIGNPGTCADIYGLSGISGSWDNCGTSACTPLVKFW